LASQRSLIEQGIVGSKKDAGAGRLGPKTREVINDTMSDRWEAN